MKTNITQHTSVATLIVLVFTIIAGAYGGYQFMQKAAKEKADIEQRIFETPEERIRNTIHVDESEEILEEFHKANILEIRDSQDAIKSRAYRDSIFKLQAVTIYQMKAIQDTILKILEHHE